MESDLQTKSASAEDYDNLFEIHEELFRDHIEEIWGWNDDWQKERFRLNWETCETVVIASGAKTVGFTQTIDTKDHLFLKNIGILPSHQGRKIGRERMIALQARARDSKKPLKLSVFVTNPRAKTFYEKLGFLVERHDKEFRHMTWTEPSVPTDEQVAYPAC